MSEETNVFTFQDDQIINEPTFEYEEELSIDKVPIIIDNGSYKCRAGWAYDANPRLVFRSLVARQRGKRDEVQVGNDILNSEANKCQIRSQFDRNIVTHFDTQEQIFDHVFSHLGIDCEGSIEHPVVITEPVCNPNYCRQQMSELLFECYRVPHVAYGVDALFSLYQNQALDSPGEDAMLISCGYQTTHVLPVLGGRLVTSQCRRIAVGGGHLDAFMQRLIQLRHSGHLAHITLPRAEELVSRFTHVNEDFEEEVRRWFSETYYLDNVVKIQLPYNASVSKVAPEVQKQRREEQARRLKSMAAKKREEKLAQEQDRLQELVLAQQILQDEEDERRYKKILKRIGFETEEDLVDEVNVLNNSIHKHNPSKVLKRIGFETEEDLADEVNALNNSIHKLMHRIQHDAQESDNKGKQSEAKKVKVDKKTTIEDPPLRNDALMTRWLENLRSEHRRLVTKKDERRRQRSDMTRRRTHASQQRMKKITELAQGRKSRKEDTFGMKDEDWNVYKEINNEGGDSDSEAEQEQIDELETYLKEYDPQFRDPTKETMDIREYYRLHVAVEQIRVPELLFQPSMLGIEQAGLAETLQFVLDKFPADQRSKLLQNVVLTGGPASLPKMAARLERELRMCSPAGSEVHVRVVQHPGLDSWRGAAKFAMQPGLESLSLSHVQFSECGELLMEHAHSNRFLPTPTGGNTAEQGCSEEGAG